MKFFITLFTAVLTLMITTAACKKSVPEPMDFRAEFFTDLVSFVPDSTSCPAPYGFRNTQTGDGSVGILGSFTTTMSFCVDPTDFKYVDGEGSFVGTNGEEIFFTIAGQVVPTTEAGYDLEFRDPFTITGGTGQFQGASGSGVTTSFVNMTTGRTDHVWAGMILLTE